MSPGAESNVTYLSKIVFVGLLALTVQAQDRPMQVAAAPGVAARPISVVIAELTKGVDARKAHPGDRVEAAVTLDTQVGTRVIVKGSKLVGHLDQVRRLAKGEADSQIEVSFEKTAMPDGSEFPILATLQAIGLRVASDANSDLPDLPTHVHDRSGCVPGMDDLRASTSQTGSESHTPAKLSTSSEGVVGLADLNLTTYVRAGTLISQIASGKKDVRLDAGTQLVVRVGER